MERLVEEIRRGMGIVENYSRNYVEYLSRGAMQRVPKPCEES